MAVLQSMDGRFYQVPDNELEQHMIPADKVIETLRAAGFCVPASGGQPGAASTAGMVTAYHHHGPGGPGGSGGPGGPGPGPFGPPMPFFGAPPPPPVYYNYRDYRNYWGGW